jgi:DNA polymerase-4
MARTILHIDLDAFFCSVEELQNPSLVGAPFAVGGRPEARGVVSSCSYAARRLGVRSAMPMARALRLAPNLKILPPRFQEYSRISSLVMEKLNQLSPLVEQVSIDEAFIDISDLPETAEVIANNLQKKINQELKLPCSIGVAGNKLVAKIANDMGKSSHVGASPPNAITIVPSGREAEFLRDLNVQKLWGVGAKTADRLGELGITTIGQLAAMPEKELVRIFGKNGHTLFLHAHGIDESPIVTSHEIKSISNETTFAHDIADEEELYRTLRELSESVGKRLRSHQLLGVTVKIKIRWPNFTTISRQARLASCIDQDEEIFLTASYLFEGAWKKGQPVRLLGVGLSGLQKNIRQLNLWETQTQVSSSKNKQLQTAIDELRERYGEKIVRQASELKKDQEW